MQGFIWYFHTLGTELENPIVATFRVKQKALKFWHMGPNTLLLMENSGTLKKNSNRLDIGNSTVYILRTPFEWVGYQGEYLGVHGGWVGPPNEYVHLLYRESLSHNSRNELIVAYKLNHI